jgi:ABC-type multidrug transport system fused ATPase/permease subunit
MAAWSLFFRSISPNAVFYLGFLVMSGYVYQRSVKDFLALVSFMEQLLSPLNSLSSSVQSIQNAFVNTERLTKTLEVQPTICDLAGAVRLENCVGHIEFHSVQSGALKGITFQCKENTVTAVLGISISEKRGLWDLLFRFRDPTAGQILIDSRNAQDYEVASLRRYIGVLHKTCELRDRTIMQNIKYGLSNPDSISDDTVFDICRDVNIHCTILKFPGGYGCQVSQKGSLDAEEARRVVLVRLLLQGLKILVLNQALLALEGESEEELQEVFKVVSSRRTIVLFE